MKTASVKNNALSNSSVTPQVRLYNNGMKAQIFVSKSLLDKAQSLASSLGITLEELSEQSLSEFIAERDAEQIVEQLNSVYAERPATVNTALQQMQFQSLPDEKW